MAGKTLRSLNISLKVLTKGFTQGFNKATKTLKKFERSVNKMGRSLTSSLTLPLAAFGTLAVKTFLDLSKNFSKIENLVGVTGKALDDLKKGVADVSTQTGISQQELSKALFVVTSAGARSTVALEILENAAKGTAVGLGDTTDIARTATAAIAAYGEKNLSAERATNVLFNTIKEGNLEAAELAPNLGKVLGVAAQMEVSFEEVNANIATFSRLGVSAADAVTGITATLSNFLNPGNKTREALDKLGLSADDVRRSIKDNGLSATLVDLIKQTGGNEDAIGALIPNIRALKNVLGVTGEQADVYLEITKRLEEDTTGLSKAFENIANEPAFKLQLALVQLKNVAIELGAILVPFVVKVAEKAKELVKQFQALDNSTKENIVKWGLFAAAIGPVLLGIGKVVAVAKGLSSMLAFLVSGPIGWTVTALMALGAIAIYLRGNWEAFGTMFGNMFKRMLNDIKGLANGIIDLLNSVLGLKDSFIKIPRFTKDIVPDVDDVTFKSFSETLKDAGKELLAFAGFSAKAKEETDALTDSVQDFNNTLTEDTTTDTRKPTPLAAFIKHPLGEIADENKRIDHNFSTSDSLGQDRLDFGPELLEAGIMKVKSAAEIAKVSIKEMVEPFNIMFDPVAAKIESLGDKILAVWNLAGEEAADFSQRMQIAAIATTEQLQALATSADASFKNLGKSALGAAQQVIRAEIAMGVAKAITNAIGTGPFGLLLAAGAGVAANAIFNNLLGALKIPALAQGGLAFGPTLAMVGDNPGASSNPEVIAPLNKLQGMLGGSNVRVMVDDIVLRGNDLVVLLEGAQENKFRTGG